MNITVSYEIGKSQIENFEGLVSEVFRSGLEIGRELIRETLEQADETLMESRDREWLSPIAFRISRYRFSICPLPETQMRAFCR